MNYKLSGGSEAHENSAEDTEILKIQSKLTPFLS